MSQLTAEQHGEYCENFLGVGDGCDVSEPDACDDSEGEIERCDVTWSNVRAAGGVVRQVRGAGLECQPIQPADGRVKTWPLEVGDGVEDTGEPVWDEDERSHQQQQHGGSVLGVLVNTSSHSE